MLLPGQVPPLTMDSRGVADRIDAESIKLDGIALENGTHPDANGKVHILVNCVDCRQTIGGLKVALNGT